MSKTVCCLCSGPCDRGNQILQGDESETRQVQVTLGVVNEGKFFEDFE